MTTYLRQDNTFNIYERGALSLQDTLEPGNYTLQANPHRGIFLKQTPSFVLPPRIYGKTVEYTDRILSTCKSRAGKTTGVLLSGAKGTGKTLLTKMVCIKSNLPVLLLPQGLPLSHVLEEISKIDQPYILLIDEMEKKFPYKSVDDDDEPRGGAAADPQPNLLSFLDGTHTGQVLVLMTTNSLFSINEFILGRPGRVFYHIRYNSLSEQEIREYCSDYFSDPEVIQDIVMGCQYLGRVSYDSLQSIVEEILRYKQSFKEAVSILNLEDTYSEAFRGSTLEYFREGEKIEDVPFATEVQYSPDLGEAYGYVPLDRVTTGVHPLGVPKENSHKISFKKDFLKREGMSYYYRFVKNYIVKFSPKPVSQAKEWYEKY